MSLRRFFASGGFLPPAVLPPAGFASGGFFGIDQIVAIGRTIFAAQNPARNFFFAEKFGGGNAFDRCDAHGDEGGFLENGKILLFED